MTAGEGGTRPVAPRGRPPTASIEKHVAEAQADRAIEWIDAHPTEFRKGRALIAERRALSPPPAAMARLDDASRRLEERFVEVAKARLAERIESARALAAAGDLDGMERVLREWPEELAGAPQAEEALRLVDPLRDEALRPGREIAEEVRSSLARWQSSGDTEGTETRDLLARLDAVLANAPRETVQRPRLLEIRGALEARLVRLSRDRRERGAREGLAAALARADADDPAGAREALERLARGEGGATDVSTLLSQVLLRGTEVDDALAHRLEGASGKPWAAVIDGRLFVGVVEKRPAARSVFGPVPLRSPTGMPLLGDLADVLAVDADLERVASWMILVGNTDAASAIAPAEGLARRVLSVSGRTPRLPRPAAGEAWADLDRRLPFLLRMPGAPAPAASGGDALFAAWADAIRANARGAPPTKPAGKPPPAVTAARAAFAAGRPLDAWTSLEAALPTAPRDAETALLRARALDALADALPTEGVALLALSEARRAWDLDPALPLAPRHLAEAYLRFRTRHAGPYAEAILPVAVEAADEAARLGKPDVAVLVFAGEQRLAQGRAKDAAVLVRRASREASEDAKVFLLLARVEDALGEPRKAMQALERARALVGDGLPEWAREMLERLSRR